MAAGKERSGGAAGPYRSYEGPTALGVPLERDERVVVFFGGALLTARVVGVAMALFLGGMGVYLSTLFGATSSTRTWILAGSLGVAALLLAFAVLARRFVARGWFLTPERLVWVSARGEATVFPVAEIHRLDVRRQVGGGGSGLLGLASVAIHAVGNAVANAREQRDPGYWRGVVQLVVLTREGDKLVLQHPRISEVGLLLAHELDDHDTLRGQPSVEHAP